MAIGPIFRALKAFKDLNVLNRLNPWALIRAWILRVLVSEREHVEASFGFGLIVGSLIQAEPTQVTSKFSSSFPPGLVRSLILESVIYLDMAVPYGQASSQCMQLRHHRVMWKLLPQKIDKFPQLFVRNLSLTRYRPKVKIFHNSLR
jgi:hypothetical protein